MTTQIECTCGAVAMGFPCKPDCARQQERKERALSRRPLEDPGWDGEWVKFRFSPDVLETRVETLAQDGETIAGLLGRQMVGIVQDIREIENDYGMGTVADLSIIDEGAPWNGLLVSFFCTSMLKRLIVQVHTGETVEITRMPNKGQAHVYEVVVLE